MFLFNIIGAAIYYFFDGVIALVKLAGVAVSFILSGLIN